jgi:hypothetical protein
VSKGKRIFFFYVIFVTLLKTVIGSMIKHENENQIIVNLYQTENQCRVLEFVGQERERRCRFCLSKEAPPPFLSNEFDTYF